MLEPADRRQFRPGDHLTVRRWWQNVIPYSHRGVYEGDGVVIDFGGDATDHVKRVSLAYFQRESPRVEVVEHGRYTLTTGYLPRSVKPQESLGRARCLLGHRVLPQPYNVIGFNCEHIANWCVAGGYCESHQTRQFFAPKARLVDGPFGLAVIRIPKLGQKAFPWVVASFLLSVDVRTTYDREIKRFYEWAEPAWQWYCAENGIA
jgi:hypothetical protein